MIKKIAIVVMFTLVLILISACGKVAEATGSDSSGNSVTNAVLSDSYIVASATTVSLNSTVSLNVMLKGAVGTVAYSWSVFGSGTISSTNAQAIVYTAASSTGNNIIQVIISDSQSVTTKNIVILVEGSASSSPSAFIETPIIYANQMGDVYELSVDGLTQLQVNSAVPIDTNYIAWATDKSFYFFIDLVNGGKLDACNLPYTTPQQANLIWQSSNPNVNEILDVNGNKILFRYGGALYLGTYTRISDTRVDLATSSLLPAGVTQNIVSATLSPDNTKIAFSIQTNAISYKPENAAGYVGDIYTANIDGSNVQKITTAGVYAVKDWSGDTLLATRYTSATASKIITISFTGGAEQDQSIAASTTYARCFSPDGTKILYLNSTEVYIVPADGLKNKVKIATTDYMSFPDWK